jgi:hypothetical protein
MFTCPLSASSAPLRESILHAKAQRTQRLCSWIKVVRVARRRDAVSSQKPPSHKKALPYFRPRDAEALPYLQNLLALPNYSDIAGYIESDVG